MSLVAVGIGIMVDIPELLTRIERKRLWAYFHKDWLLQIRELLRPQLPAGWHWQNVF